MAGWVGGERRTHVNQASSIKHCRAGGCRKYEVLSLKIVHRRHCTGFEQNRELPLHIDDLIAGRYQVGARVGPVGSGRLATNTRERLLSMACLLAWWPSHALPCPPCHRRRLWTC